MFQLFDLSITNRSGLMLASPALSRELRPPASSISLLVMSRKGCSSASCHCVSHNSNVDESGNLTTGPANCGEDLVGGGRPCQPDRAWLASLAPATTFIRGLSLCFPTHVKSFTMPQAIRHLGNA